VKDQSDDHQIHANVKDNGRGKVHVAKEWQQYFDVVGLENFTTKEQRHQTSDGSHCQPGTKDDSGRGSERLLKFVTAARQITDGKRDTGQQTTGEASAGQVVTGDQ